MCVWQKEKQDFSFFLLAYDFKRLKMSRGMRRYRDFSCLVKFHLISIFIGNFIE